MADESRLFHLKVVAPDRIFFDGDADMVEIRTTEGEIGVLKNHIPLTAILKPGPLRIKKDGEIQAAALHDGFVEVFKDHVMILAEACEWPNEIDLERAKESKERAEKRLASGDSNVNIARAEAALRRALLRIEMAQPKE